jgi:two-component system chemotaxis response regulator CheB
MIPIVVIAGSAGALAPLRRIVATLPDPCAAAVFVVIHIGPNPSVLPSLLQKVCRLPVAFARNGTEIEGGHIYVAPPDQHMLVNLNSILLNWGPKVHSTRPAADPLFISAAKVHGDRVMGIILSGGDGDGAEGLRTIKEHGGVALVQRPEDAASPSMPNAAIAADHPDACLPIGEIAHRVRAFCS